MGEFEVVVCAGISYAVELDTSAPAAAAEEFLRLVDAVAEVPRAIRAGASVDRARA